MVNYYPSVENEFVIIDPFKYGKQLIGQDEQLPLIGTAINQPMNHFPRSILGECRGGGRGGGMHPPLDAEVRGGGKYGKGQCP